MAAPLNYRHLYYFWVVAKEGGMSRAAARLDMAVQTISEQVRLLEQSLGHALFKPAGRGLVLTEAGAVAMAQAEQIFQLGEQLPAAVRDAAPGRGCGSLWASRTGCRSWSCAICCNQHSPDAGCGCCARRTSSAATGRLGAAPAGRCLVGPGSAAQPQPAALQSPTRRSRIGLVSAGGNGEEIQEALPGVAGRHAAPATNRPFGRSSAA